jgi:hypothetical protein
MKELLKHAGYVITICTSVWISHPLVTFCRKTAPWYFFASESGILSISGVSGTGIGFWILDINPVFSRSPGVFLQISVTQK